MSARFFLSNPKQETSSINIILRHNKKRCKKGIGVSVETKYWDKKRQRASVTQKYRDGVLVNFEIEKWDKAIDRMIYNTTLNNISVNEAKYFWKLVECEMTGAPYPAHLQSTNSFTEYFEQMFIPRFTTTKSYSRIQRFNIALKKIKDFETYREQSYKFEDVNTIFYRDLQSYMNSLGHSANYFGAIIKIVLV